MTTKLPPIPLAPDEVFPVILDGIPGYANAHTGRFVPVLKGGQVAAGPRGPRTNGAQSAQPVASVPFTGASHEHVEPVLTTTVIPGANVQQLGPWDVPAYGYLASLFVQVTGAG